MHDYRAQLGRAGINRVALSCRARRRHGIAAPRRDGRPIGRPPTRPTTSRVPPNAKAEEISRLPPHHRAAAASCRDRRRLTGLHDHRVDVGELSGVRAPLPHVARGRRDRRVERVRGRLHRRRQGGRSDRSAVPNAPTISGRCPTAPARSLGCSFCKGEPLIPRQGHVWYVRSMTFAAAPKRGRRSTSRVPAGSRETAC